MKEDAVLAEAVSAYTSGDKHKALLMLKVSKRMNPREAVEAIQACIQKTTSHSGLQADEEQSVKEAMDSVAVFDELTEMVLRHMRDSKDPIATRTMDVAEVQVHCQQIYEAMAALMRANVNPTRVMTAHIMRAYVSRSPDPKALENAMKPTLLEDIISLV